MSVILSHTSALERLRAVPPRFDKAVPVGAMPAQEDSRPDCRKINRIDFKSFGVIQEPIHLLVPGNTRGNRSKRFFFHALNSCAIPLEAVRKIDDAVYSVTPELCFIQVSRKTSLIGSVVLGFELCGSYSHFAPLVSGFYERDPLTSTQSISNMLDKLKGLRGSNRAQEALPWILDGSASPMETVLACMLTLPSQLGGEEFVAPKLNCKVDLDETEKLMTETDSCRIDLAWDDQKVGLEYYGGPYHTDAVADRKRREALAHAGWTIYVVDIDRMCNYSEYAKLLALLKDAIPRSHHHSPATKSLSKNLLKRLLNATRCSMGLEAALFAPCVPPRSIRIHVR